MIETSKRLYRSGDTPQLRQRAEKTKATMSDDYYRQLTSERIKRWRKEHPEEYELARENNRVAMQSPAVKEKRRETRKNGLRNTRRNIRHNRSGYLSFAILRRQERDAPRP